MRSDFWPPHTQVSFPSLQDVAGLPRGPPWLGLHLYSQSPRPLTGPTTPACPDKWQVQEAVESIQGLALSWRVWEMEGSGSCHFNLEFFWLLAHAQTHFCFKGTIFGNRLAVGEWENRVPCSALEIPQAHRDHCWLWQGQGSGVRLLPGTRRLAWGGASPAPTLGQE